MSACSSAIIFCRFTSWTKGLRMTPFSRVITLLSGVLRSRRLAIVVDLGLPRGFLRRYDVYHQDIANHLLISTRQHLCGRIVVLSLLDQIVSTVKRLTVTVILIPVVVKIVIVEQVISNIVVFIFSWIPGRIVIMFQ